MAHWARERGNRAVLVPVLSAHQIVGIHAKNSRPETTVFKIQDLHSWAQSHKMIIILALLFFITRFTSFNPPLNPHLRHHRLIPHHWLHLDLPSSYHFLSLSFYWIIRHFLQVIHPHILEWLSHTLSWTPWFLTRISFCLTELGPDIFFFLSRLFISIIWRLIWWGQTSWALSILGMYLDVFQRNSASFLGNR